MKRSIKSLESKMVRSHTLANSQLIRASEKADELLDKALDALFEQASPRTDVTISQCIKQFETDITEEYCEISSIARILREELQKRKL